jgi:hypothetical protein
MGDVQVEPITTRLGRTGALSGEDLRYIARLEQLASAKTMAVATNGRFPYWSLERWLLVLNLVAVCIGGIWFAGSQWSGVKRDVAETKQNIQQLQDSARDDRAATDRKLEDLKQQIAKQGRR